MKSLSIPCATAAVLLVLMGGLGSPAYSQGVTALPVPVSVRENFYAGQRAAHVLVDPAYNTWGMSVIRWKDGTYHGYYARWPKATGHAGWMTHCEIAHAVAEKPEGPFEPVGTAVASRHLEGWDIVNAHNPYVTLAGDKICLYYISNKLRGRFEAEEPGSYPSEDWMTKNRKDIVRNAQCTGVAVADDPAGPFVRAPDPVVEPHGLFKNIAVNPAVVFQDGRYVMVIKGDDVRKEGWFRIQLVGHAAEPQGPFTFQDRPIFDKVQTEDACLWFDRDTQRYNMVCHVMGKRDLARFVSPDSLTWTPANPPVFLPKSIPLDDGTVWKPKRVERPFVLTDERGKPVMIYLSVMDKEFHGNIALTLKANP